MKYYESYFGSNSQILKQSTFYEALQILTKNDQMVLSSVNYVQSLLVNDTIENLQFMIEDLVNDAIEQEYLKSIWVHCQYF